jgi:ribosomal protein L16/L10AE
VDGVTAEMAREGFALAAAKLPIKTKMVARIGA